jgi:hypothetical protein
LQWPHDLSWRYDTSTGQRSSSILYYPGVREQIDVVNLTAVGRCQEKYGFGCFFNRTGSPKRNVRKSAFTLSLLRALFLLAACSCKSQIAQVTGDAQNAATSNVGGQPIVSLPLAPRWRCVCNAGFQHCFAA